MSTSEVSRSEGPCNLVGNGTQLSEPVLWTALEHKGDLVAIRDCLSLRLSADKFEESIRQNVSVSIEARGIRSLGGFVRMSDRLVISEAVLIPRPDAAKLRPEHPWRT